MKIRDRVRGWLIATLETTVPSFAVKYMIVIAASIVGGCTYARTGSWVEAVRWDIFDLFVFWGVSKITEIISEYIVKAILYILSDGPIHPNTGEPI